MPALSLLACCSDSKSEERAAEAARGVPAHGVDGAHTARPARPAYPALLANMQQDGPRLSDGVRYRKPERFRGTLALAFEQVDFVEDRAGRPRRAVHLVAADTATDECLGRLGAEDRAGRRLRVSFIGRRSVEEEGSFGHMGMRSSQVRLERFLSSNPCK